VEFQDELAGGTVLVRPALQSPGYVAGVSGWAVFIDGSAEFNNLTIRGVFQGTNFILNSNGLFLYSGTPAAGNLIASITPTFGTDTFGNTYLEGVNSYAGSAFAGLVAGNLLLGLIAQPAASGVVGLSGTDTVFLSSPTASDPDAATLALVAGDTTVTPRSAAGYPHVDIGAATAGTLAWINGAIIASTVSAGTSTAETWHAPAYNANWSGTTVYGALAGGLGTLRYRKDAEDNTWLLGCFTAAAGAASAVFQLPTGYRPATNYPFPVAFISGGGVAGNAWMYVSSAGNLNINAQLGSAVTAGTVYVVNAKVPRGNVA
jgi:hypothetical protein